MKLEWQYCGTKPMKVKTFLKRQQVSRRLLSKVRHEGGGILIDEQEGRAVDQLLPAQTITVLLPPERGRKGEIVPSFVPIEIIYEDRDILVINKPPHVPSVPSVLYPGDSLVNRISGYYRIRGYMGVVPHIVSRLDRDTSGLVLFAKHRYAHSLLDKQMQQRQIIKEYLALLTGEIPEENEFDITAAIKRDPNSLFKRQISQTGQQAFTHIKCLQSGSLGSLCLVTPKTGRTHQIRVHCASIGHPLQGDTMYGKQAHQHLDRQALHCWRLHFKQPLTGKMLAFSAPLPPDMYNYSKNI